MATLIAEHAGVMKDLRGNGQKGIRDTIVEFIAAYHEREKNRHDSEIRWRWTMGFILSLLTLLEAVQKIHF